MSPGRAQVVGTVAGAWMAGLQLLADDLRLVGVRPMVDPAALADVITIAVDQLIPPSVEVTPQIAAAGGTSILGVQRLIHARKIAEAKRQAAAGGGADVRERTAPVGDVMRERAAQADAAPPAPDAPDPDPSSLRASGPVIDVVEPKPSAAEQHPGYSPPPARYLTAESEARLVF